MLKFIAGYSDRVATYVRARNWTPAGGGNEHGWSVRRLYQAEGLWGVTTTNGRLIAVLPPEGASNQSAPSSTRPTSGTSSSPRSGVTKPTMPYAYTIDPIFARP